MDKISECHFDTRSRRIDPKGFTSEAEFVTASQAGQEAHNLLETHTDFEYSSPKATLI